MQIRFSRGPAVVAGPYAASTEEETRRNIQNAVNIGQLLVQRGFCPVLVPHALGAAGLYGQATDDGSESTAREDALWHGAATARLVALAGGQLFAIRNSDGGFSDGTFREVEAFVLALDDAFPRGTTQSHLTTDTYDRLVNTILSEFSVCTQNDTQED